MCVLSWTLPDAVNLARGGGLTVSQNRDSETNRPGLRRQINQHNEEQPSVRTNMPYGISAVNSIDANRAGQLFDASNPALNAYTNPNTSGVTFRTSWADVEPQDGKFNFSQIDTVFANAEKNGKWVELILIPGFGTPGWALRGVQSGTFAIPYGPGAGTLLALPVPWDRTYLSRWFAFLKVIADRYGGKNSFRKIAAAGPTSVSAEMSLPESRNDIVLWRQLGYTSEKYIDAWRQTFSAYSATFPNQYFSLALHPALPIPDRNQKAHAREQIVNLGLQYPRQFALQADGLNANSADEKYGYSAVRDHSGRVATGFMMTTAATLRPQRMGPSADPVDNLRRSIATGLVPNARGQVVKYLEIYEPDIVNPAMQQVLHEGQQKLATSASP
jgi:Beta-galactosidase